MIYDMLPLASSGGGEANTSSNAGAGAGLALAKSGVDLPFKSLVAGTNITLTPSADVVTIAAAGGAGGGVTIDADGLITIDGTDIPPFRPEIVVDGAVRTFKMVVKDPSDGHIAVVGSAVE